MLDVDMSLTTLSVLVDGFCRSQAWEAINMLT